jgi:hypothetical protein
MVNEWRAIERAGEWAGLDTQQRDEYFVVVADIHNAEISSYGEFENYGEEYHDFLNSRVFSDDRVVDLLQSFGVDEATVDAFATGTVPVAETYHSEQLLEYGLDELVDLIMMLRLFDRYTTVADEPCLESRYRFQKLLFVTNLELKRTQTGSVVDESEFGLLETTGYRYSFRKRSSGPFSRSAYVDKDRLYANGLVEETIISDEGTGEVAEHEHTYGLELTLDGQMLLSRFDSVLGDFDSEILSDWDRAQERAISSLAGKTVDQIRAYIDSETDVAPRETGERLLPPRQATFTGDDDSADDAAEVSVDA